MKSPTSEAFFMHYLFLTERETSFEACHDLAIALVNARAKAKELKSKIVLKYYNTDTFGQRSGPFGSLRQAKKAASIYVKLCLTKCREDSVTIKDQLGTVHHFINFKNA